MVWTHEQPSQVCAEQGEVLIDGPGGVAVALSPDAAIETAERLVHAATEAHGQRLTAEWTDAAEERPNASVMIVRPVR